MFIFKLLITLIYITKSINGNIYEKCINPKHITFTFDDGPDEITQQLVNILNKYQIKGTFFINGINIIKNPKYKNMLKQINNEGHILSSHTFSHSALEKINKFNIYRELYDNELIFRELINMRPRYFRPPYFSYNDDIFDVINNHFGYDLIATNMMANDWDGISSQAIYDFWVNKLITEPETGKIILIHDDIFNNIQALEIFIEYGLSNNYTFVNLIDCVGHITAYIEDNKYSPNLLNGINN